VSAIKKIHPVDPIFTDKAFYRQIKQYEGIAGYFKGLGPNLVGVIPAR
jgi:hypothetical protein